MIEQIEQAAQLIAREADADKITKLQAYLPRSTNSSKEPLLLIANLLSISTENQQRPIRAYAATNKEQNDQHACRNAVGVFRATSHALHL